MIKESYDILLLDLDDQIEGVDTEDEIDRNTNVDDQSEGFENSNGPWGGNSDEQHQESD